MPFDQQHSYLLKAFCVLRPGGVAVVEMANRLYPQDPHPRFWFASYFPMPVFRWYVKARGRFPKSATFWDTYPMNLGSFHSLCKRADFKWIGGKSYLRRILRTDSRRLKLLCVLDKLGLPDDWFAGALVGCFESPTKSECWQ